MILDVATASIATGVPARTIQRWVRNRWLADHSDGTRAILVDVDELAVLADTRPNGRLVFPSSVA